MKHWLLLCSFFICPFVFAENDADDQLSIKQVAQFSGIPWGITLLNDQQAVITLKQGLIYRVNLVNGRETEIKGAPKVDSRGQGGLLDVAKSPHFKQQPWLYFTYSKPTKTGSTTTLARGLLRHNQLTQWQDLFIANASSQYHHHFGGRIAFDDKSHVFFTVGDRGNRDNAQDLFNHAGTIIRLYLDGRIPSDNPFVGNPMADDAIWSYGHRNPQGLYYDTKEDKLWSNEHGPKGGDEINLIRRGANYGWPIVSYGVEYSNSQPIGEGSEKDGIEKPLKVFIPSIAPSALMKYHGKLFSDWNGSFLSTALALQHLNKIETKQDGKQKEERYLSSLHERFRAIAQDSEGRLYLTTDSGKLLRITRKEPANTP